MTDFTKAFVTLQGIDAVNDLLDRLKPSNIRQQDRAAVQEVQDALYALTNDTDVIELRNEPSNRASATISPTGYIDVNEPKPSAKPKLEIEKILILSTAHITHRVSHNFLSLVPGSIDYKDCGHLMPLYEGQEVDELPRCVAKAVDLARANGCVWLLFDKDGPVIDDLTIYDW